MNIVIAGANEVGAYLARMFTAEGHDVTVVDTSAERLYSLQSSMDVSTFIGSAASRTVLENVDVGHVRLFAAVTEHDDLNMVSCMKAKAMGVKNTAAMVDKVEFFDDRSGVYKDWLGIDLVLNTRFLVAHEINKLIRTRGAVAVEDFAGNRIEMVQFRVTSETPYTERPLLELSLPWECLIVAIKRGRSLIIPRGDDAIHLGDEIMVMGRTEEMTSIEDAFGGGARKGRKCMLLGGGTVGFVLAKSLQGLVEEVALIEQDRDRCDFLSRELEAVTVIHGDGTDVDLLQEEGIDACEVFAAVSGEDEKNIIAARLVKELGVDRCIALVSKPDYTEVCRHLGLEVVPSPSTIIAREVGHSLMPGGLLGITPVMGGVAEFVEVMVPSDTHVAGKRLKDAGFPRGAVMCAVIDSNGFTIPRGDTVIEPGNRVIVFTLTSIRPKVRKLFGI